MDDKAIDLSKIRTYSIKERTSKVHKEDLGRPFLAGSFDEFIDSLPNINAARDIRLLAKSVAKAHKDGRQVMLGMGAHVIKCGLSPVVNRLISDGIITCVAVNGACMVHDFELAFAGMTSEVVDEALEDGCFGMARETGEFINNAINDGVKDGFGLGASLGKKLVPLPFSSYSIFKTAFECDIPITVHVAIGTDIVHLHPNCNPEAVGLGSHRDFLTFSSAVANMENGVYINLGSAVILPEVFLKAVTLARNLGHELKSIVTANMDFIQHYRPNTNVVRRPTTSGKGFSITGHHEIMLPMLAALIYREIQ